MAVRNVTSERPLNIIHVFRAPLGGLFRHVADLVAGQIERGHRLGIIADSTQYGPYPESILAGLKDRLVHGLTRIPISREIGLSDISGTRHVAQRMREANADVVHGHGAKGGAFARLAAPFHPAVRVYTLHGGSLLYRPGSLGHIFYITLEKLLRPRTDLFLFESAYIGDLYRRKIGEPKALSRVVRNGVAGRDLELAKPGPNATDLFFIGELRPIKGVDVLIDAIADLKQSGLPLTATIVGDGASRAALEQQVQQRGLANEIKFTGAIPARQAFALGKLAVIPSRGESMPYVVIELAAAQVPLIATNVGGIPDIFGDQAGRLLPPDDRSALAHAITDAVKNPETIRAQSLALRERIKTSFSLDHMVDEALAAYRDAIKSKSQ